MEVVKILNDDIKIIYRIRRDWGNYDEWIINTQKLLNSDCLTQPKLVAIWK